MHVLDTLGYIEYEGTHTQQTWLSQAFHMVVAKGCYKVNHVTLLYKQRRNAFFFLVADVRPSPLAPCFFCSVISIIQLTQKKDGNWIHVFLTTTYRYTLPTRGSTVILVESTLCSDSLSSGGWPLVQAFRWSSTVLTFLQHEQNLSEELNKPRY